MSDNGNPLKYRALLFFIFLLVAGLSGYTFYKYFYSSIMIQGYSYLSDDLKNVEYLFENEGMSKDACLNDCEKDYLCKGLTYDASRNICYGLTNGKLRSDDPHIFAWVKDLAKAEIDNNDNMLVSWTANYKHINKRSIPTANFINKYAINFWFRIDDWYDNYALWRNIIYQGNELTEHNLTATTWGDVITKIPKQKFGVWLAPYTNNIRIAVGVKVPINKGNADEHPVNQICANKNCYIKTNRGNDDFHYELEFIDIKNVDVGIPNMISIIMDRRSFNVYYNGKLRENIFLSGEAVQIDSDCFVKLDKSYTGPFMNFRVWTSTISSGQVNELYKNELQAMISNDRGK